MISMALINVVYVFLQSGWNITSYIVCLFILISLGGGLILAFLRNTGWIQEKATSLLVFILVFPALYFISMYAIKLLDAILYQNILNFLAIKSLAIKDLVPVISMLEEDFEVILIKDRLSELLAHYFVASIWFVLSFYLIFSMMISLSIKEKEGILLNGSDFLKKNKGKVAPLIWFRYFFSIALIWYGYFHSSVDTQCTIRCSSVLNSDFPLFITTFYGGFVLAFCIGIDFKIIMIKRFLNGRE